MLYLILAISTAPIITVAFRLSNKYIKNKMMMFFVNYLSCSICALFFLNNLSEYSNEELTFPIWFGIVMGIFFLITFLFYEFNIRKNGIILSNIFSKLGKIVPVIITLIMFNEVPTRLKIIGIILSIIAVIIMNIEFKRKEDPSNDCLEEDNEEKERRGVNASFIFLIIFLLLSGITDSSTTIFKHMSVKELNGFFLLFVFGSAMFLSLIILIIKHQKIGLSDIIFGLIIGIPNYFSSFFTLKALESIPAQVVYPSYCVGSILIITIIGVIAFKEKLKIKDYIGILIIIAALILLNI